MHEKILWDLLDSALRNEEPVMTPIERKYPSFHATSARDKQKQRSAFKIRNSGKKPRHKNRGMAMTKRAESGIINQKQTKPRR